MKNTDANTGELSLPCLFSLSASLTWQIDRIPYSIKYLTGNPLRLRFVIRYLISFLPASRWSNNFHSLRSRRLRPDNSLVLKSCHVRSSILSWKWIWD
ncbi:hypothetical protein NXX40_25805 (plasmid) [Parabacteroides distasonis]|nr:hypothetical protein [Parabacteroides distasonis]